MIRVVLRKVARTGRDMKKWIKDKQVTTDHGKCRHQQQTDSPGPWMPTVRLDADKFYQNFLSTEE